MASDRAKAFADKCVSRFYGDGGWYVAAFELCEYRGMQDETKSTEECVVEVIADALDAYEREAWTPTAQALPVGGVDVLWLADSGVVFSGSRDGEQVRFVLGLSIDLADVTHWRPLPHGPKGW